MNMSMFEQRILLQLYGENQKQYEDLVPLVSSQRAGMAVTTIKEMQTKIQKLEDENRVLRKRNGQLSQIDLFKGQHDEKRSR